MSARFRFGSTRLIVFRVSMPAVAIHSWRHEIRVVRVLSAC
jgi:hypothetical protein